MKNLFRFLVLLISLFAYPCLLIAQWVQCNGPYGGNLLCFASKGANLLVGGNGGVFRSTDSGSSWLYTGFRNVSVVALEAFATGAGGTVFFAGVDSGTSAGAGAVFLSTDNGSSWTPASTGLQSAIVNSFAATSGSAGDTLLFAATNIGVFRSSDHGASWLSSGLTVSDMYALAVCPNGAGGTSLFAGGFYGISRSTDDGTSWVAADSGFAGQHITNCFAVSPNGEGGTSIFAGTDFGIYLSTDNGDSWTEVYADSTHSIDLDGLAHFIYVHGLSVSPNGKGGTNIFAGDETGVYLSTDYGKHWTQVNTGLTNYYIHNLASYPNGTGGTNLFAATSDGVFLSTDNGGRWAETSAGLICQRVNAPITSGANLFAATDNGIFRSVNDGKDWIRVITGLTTPYVEALAMVPTEAGDTILLAATDSSVIRSTDNGAGWESADSGLIVGNSNFRCFASSSSGAGGTIIFLGASRLSVVNYSYPPTSGVYRSSDYGATWVYTGVGERFVNALLVSRGNVFVGTYTGVYRSADNGEHWTKVNTGLIDSVVEALAGTDSGIFAGTSFGGGVFRSTNEGETWTQVNDGMANASVNSLLALSRDEGRTALFAGTDSSVFLSVDNGATWKTVGAGLEGMEILSLAVSGENLFAGTLTNGVWRRPLSEMMTPVSTRTGEPPREFSLRQNYPNPFNPTTYISYQLPINALVILKVYDVIGREVRTLVNERQPAGVHSVRFNASNLPSGVYFYRMRAGPVIQTKKSVVIK
jgi:hypothetical protein